MALARRSGSRFTASIWPGFVDALTALLLILMFVLSIFMIIQFSLRERITGQDKKLESLNEDLIAREEVIQKNESQIDTLTGQLAELSNALGLERDRTANLQTEVGSLRSTLSDERAEIDRLSTALGAMTQQFQTQQAEATRLSAELTAETEARTADVERLSGELSVSQQEALALQSALTSARSEIDTQAEEARLAAARREALDALVARLEADRNAKETDLRALEADKARALALIDALQADKEETEAELAATLQDRENIQKQLEDVDIERAAAVAMIARLEQQNSGILADVEKLDSEKAAALALIAQLEAARAQDTQTLAELEQERLDRQALIEQLDNDKAVALALVETFKASLAADQAALAETEAELAARQAQLQQLQEQNTQRLAAFESLSSEQALALATIAQLEAERDQLAEQAQAQGNTAEEFQFELKAALDRAAELSARLTQEEEARLADAAAAQALRERLGDSQTELDSVTLALEAARKKAEETLTLLAAAEASRRQLSDSALAAADKIDRELALRAIAESELAKAEAQTLEEQRKVAVLNAQVKELNTQLGSLQSLLDAASERDKQAKVQIAELGSKLNQALAQKVSELSRFRSEFFGKMRDVLGGREGIQVVGDRFVFQSEILFSSASAILGPEGQTELSKLADVVRELSAEAPDGLNWVLRVDGHTDPVPLSGRGRFRDNWELSQARALSVVRYLIDVEGIPPSRLAATGFGEWQPIVEGDGPDANARNRRIEFKFTER